MLDGTIEADLGEMCRTQSFYTALGSVNINQDGCPELMTKQSESAFLNEAQKTVAMQMIGLEREWESSEKRRRNKQ